jgi:hypothetical protein
VVLDLGRGDLLQVIPLTAGFVKYFGVSQLLQTEDEC